MADAAAANGAPRVVIANPGAVIPLKDAAGAFAEIGSLDTYISTFGFGASEVERLGRLIPGPAGRRLTLELRRRAVPDEVGDRARRAATAFDAVNVLLNRTPLPKSIKHAAWRPTRLLFDRRVSQILTGEVDAVVGYQGAAVATFRRARELDIGTVLDYPIAHFVFTERVLTEEAQLVPKFAPTLRLQRYPAWLRRRYIEEMQLADRIITVSENHRRTFEEAGIDPARTFMVPWYVDTELFAPGERRDDGVFRVAFLGQITQRKGISYLIDGFRAAKLDDAELVMIGSPIGSTAPWINTPGLRHVPPMPRFRLPEILQTCDVICLPSLVEGFPISVLEGMACGLPAIISENLGRDIVGDGVEGFVVPIRDPEAIADRLRLLHSDVDRRRTMSRAARAKAETFTRERNRESLRRGVNAMLAERHG